MGFAALVVLALALAPRLQFDSDPLDTQSPNTEAMRTLRDLMNQPLSNPYSIDILAPKRGSRRALLAAKLRQLPTVSNVLTIESFVPDEQTAKLALVADAADILATELVAATMRAPVTPAEIRTAAQSALAQIDPALHLLPHGDPLNAIAGDLGAIAHAPDSTVRAVDGALTRFLPLELDRLAHRSRRRAGRCLIGAAGYRTRLVPAGRAGAGRGAAGRLGAQQPGAAPVRRSRSRAWHPMPAARR